MMMSLGDIDVMGLMDRLLVKKQKLLEQLDRGKVVTEQMKAERLRKRHNNISNMKPGAKKAILEGLVMKKSPLDVMKEEYSRRKYERNKKYNR
jgi:hypothetical protein